MVKVIESLEEFEGLLKDNGSKLTVVDFFATWCGPCKMIAPKIEEFEKTYGDVVFCKVDVDDAGDVAEKYEISAMPTLLFFKNGEKIETVVGANLGAIEEAVKKNQ